MSIRAVRTGSGIPASSSASTAGTGPRGSSSSSSAVAPSSSSAPSQQQQGGVMESSTGSGASEVEDLIGDLGPANHLFRDMLRAQRAAFIERLEKMAMDDESVDPSDKTIETALEAVLKYIATKPARDVEALSLFSLSDFGMSRAGLYNIAYYVTQLHEARQKAAAATPGSVSSPSSETSNTSNSNGSMRRYSWGSKSPSNLRSPATTPSASQPMTRATHGTSNNISSGGSGGGGGPALYNNSMSYGGSTDYENDLYEEDFEAAEEEVPYEDDDEDDAGYTDTSMHTSTLIIDEDDMHHHHNVNAGANNNSSNHNNGIRPKPIVSQSVERFTPAPRSNTLGAIDRGAGAVVGGGGGGGRPSTSISSSVGPAPSSSVSASAVAPNGVVAAAQGARVSSSVQESKAKDKTWIAKGNWRIGEKIGSGSFGEVFQGLNGYGKLFAVKRLVLAGGKMADLENLVSEIELMRSLSHPNIVEYIGTKVDVKTGFVYIFQEWVPGGSVASMLKKFGPFQVGVVHAYTQQILLGLEYLHSHGIVHRDIKGGNILVDDAGHVKLADFGASTKVMFDETQETHTIKGTPYFMAPEVLSQSKYGRKGDIWAVGCTVIQMLTGEPPWKSNNLQSIIQLHMLLSTRPEGPPPVDRSIPDILQDFLVTIFKTDPRNRPTATELLQHPFLSDDSLEESMSGTMGPSGAMFNNKPYTDDGGSGSGGSTRDLLRLKAGEDANNSSINLKAKLEMAAAGGRPPKNYEDTMQYIDAQIASRAASKPYNPYSNVAAEQSTGVGGEATAVRISVPGQQGRAQASPAGSPITPRQHEFDPRQMQHQRAVRASAAGAAAVPGGARYSGGGSSAAGSEYGYDAQDSMNYSESETRSPSRQIPRPYSGDQRPGSGHGNNVLSIGTRVDARYRGRDRWYPGVISRVRQNGQSYDIDYDDGELETHVTRDLIHVVGGSAGESKDTQGGSEGYDGEERGGSGVPPISPGGAELLILPKRSGTGSGSPSVANPFAKRPDTASAGQGVVASRKSTSSGINQGLPALHGDMYRDEGRAVPSGGLPPRDIGPRASLGGVRPSTSAAASEQPYASDAVDYRRRNIQTAGAADVSKLTSGLGNEVIPKSQLAALKSSISSNGGGLVTAVKRRNSKNSEEMNSAAASAVGGKVPPLPLEMKNSQSEQVLPTYSTNTSGSGVGSNLSSRSNSGIDAGHIGSARDSEPDRPRSTEDTPRRLDPLTRRRPSNSDAAAMAALVAGEEAESGTPTAGTGHGAAHDTWRCLKCGALNDVEEGVDYCGSCSTRRGYSGARGIGAQVIKYG